MLYQVTPNVRSRNYPTLQNIEKKKKVMELQEESGAVLETAQFG